MRTFLYHPFILLTARLILGCIFIIASIEKIAVPEVFAISIEAYKILPTELVNIFALIIPWVELIAGIFLIGSVYVEASAALITLLLIVFIMAIGSAMARGLTIDCGCFGPAHSTPVGWGKILEDIGMLLLGLYIVFACRTRPEEKDAIHDQLGSEIPDIHR